MSKEGHFYVTTTLPYVNADPHIGFALELVQADVLARYNRLIGNKVLFNTGTDEHGQKIYQKAIEQDIDPQDYVDEYSKRFKELRGALNLSYNNFIRTTDKDHVKAAQEMWRKCEEGGDIYKADYEIKYCVGCEMEKTDSELEDGRCALHPNKEIEIRKEENYFFKFSKYEKELMKLYESGDNFIVPKNRLLEMKNFVESGLKDFSISRLKEKMPWGIPVPGDDEHVMYVWFDALTNYIAAAGWPENKSGFDKWWPAVQVAGKDNLRQQGAMWQAMLLSAGLPNSKQVLIHGFITSDGKKMSKSLGNVVNPFDLVEEYGAEAVRYYLLAKISSDKDGDFTTERFEEVYQSDLANGLGNLLSRVTAMAEKSEWQFPKREEYGINLMVGEKIENFEFSKAMEIIWEDIRSADRYINEEKVWELEGEDQAEALDLLINKMRQIAMDLTPFMPEISKKIQKRLEGDKIKKSEGIFPRLE